MVEINSVPILFKNKENCCGCGACLNICPKQAISMAEDECGFIYPKINDQLCINCGQCQKVCNFQHVKITNSPISCFAAVSKDLEQSKHSASGGIFAAIAKDTIKIGGIVFGAAFDDSWKVKHISADTMQKIIAIQGSKYVHSDIGKTYAEAKEHLISGRDVLFSGTPCQIAGLYGYLGKDYENLITVDIVCHGVPSNKMFNEYLRTIEKKYGGTIDSFTFRDKSIGWGKNGSVIINKKKVKIWQSASSYLYYFAKGWIYRENCYKCPYACANRPADITLGDYWGIEKQHPELLGKNRWDENKGISCLIVNTVKGKNAIEKLELDLIPSAFDKIAEGNGQLRSPCKPGLRNEIMETYINHGWDTLDNQFKKSNKLYQYSSLIKSFLPSAIKRRLKKHL